MSDKGDKASSSSNSQNSQNLAYSHSDDNTGYMYPINTYTAVPEFTNLNYISPAINSSSPEFEVVNYNASNNGNPSSNFIGSQGSGGNQINVLESQGINSGNYDIGQENFVSFIENSNSEHSFGANGLDNSKHSHNTANFVGSAGENQQSNETSDIISLMKELISQMKNSTNSQNSLTTQLSSLINAQNSLTTQLSSSINAQNSLTTQLSSLTTQLSSSINAQNSLTTQLSSSINAQNSLTQTIKELINNNQLK